jgi:hypothetical protein
MQIGNSNTTPSKSVFNIQKTDNDLPLQTAIPLDPLSAEKERLKNLPKLSTCMSIQTFALILGDTFVKGTSYQGQSITKQINYWSECFKYWLNPSESLPFHPDIENKTLNELYENFCSFGEIAEEFLTAEPNELRELINRRLTEKHHCTIPLKTRAPKDGVGHVFSCILEQDNEGSITAFILNAGAGSEMHPLAEVDIHPKHSFMFPPIKFHEKYFFRDNPEFANYLLKLICYYARETPDSNYNPQEIYGMFLELGDLLPINSDFNYGVQSQRSGTCPAKAMKLLNRHFFLKDVVLDNYKKTPFYFKLMSVYHIYKQINSVEFANNDKLLIIRSIRQFAYNLDKVRNLPIPIIDKQTLLTAQALIELIDEHKFTITDPKTGFIDLEEVHETRFQVTEDVEKSEEKNKIGNDFKYELAAVSFDCPKPEELKFFLQEMCENFKVTEKTKGEELNFRSISCMHVVNCLPIPSGNNDSYWDAVPEADRLDIMKTLTQLVCNSNRCPTPFRNENISFIFLMQFATCSIIDFLARKNPDMKLDGVSCELYMKGSVDQINANNLFVTGESIKRYNLIIEYFSSNQNKHLIFDFTRKAEQVSLNHSEGVWSRHSNENFDIGGHLRYLDRMLPEDNPKESWLYLSLISNYNFADQKLGLKEIFEKVRACIPQEYFYLQKACVGVQNYLIAPFNVRENDYEVDAPPFVIKDIFDDRRSSIHLNERKKNTKSLSFESKFTYNSKNENHHILNTVINSEISRATTNMLVDLYKMFDLSQTKSSLAIKFAQDFPEILDHPQIQFLIKKALLNNLSVMEQIKLEPMSVPILYQFFDQMIEKSELNSSINELHYWITLAMLVETHISVVLEKEIPAERIRFYIERSEKSFQKIMKIDMQAGGDLENKEITYNCDLNKFYITNVLIAGLSKNKLDPDTDGDLIEFYIKYFILYYVNLHTAIHSLDKESTHLIEECFIKHSLAIKAYIEKKSPIKAFEAVLQHLKIDATAKDDTIEATWPFYSFVNSENRTVSIQFPYIYIDNLKLENGLWPQHFQLDYFHGEFPPVIRIGNQKVRAQDGSFEITNGEKIEFLKKFKFNHEERFLLYIVINVNRSRFYNLNISNFPTFLKNNYYFWKDRDSGVIWMINKKDQIPFGQIASDHTQPNCMRIQRVNQFWKPIKDQFLLQIPDSSLWASYLKELYHSDKIIAWGSENGIISQLFIPDQSLSFQIKNIEGESIAIYERNSEYRLISSEEIPNALSTAIYLNKTDDSNKKGMILPFNEISTGSFKSDARNGNTLGNNHFFYELDAKTGIWHCSTQLGEFYLIYVFQQHGKFDLAAEYLNNFVPTSSFQELQIKILEKMLDKRNFDIQSISIGIKAYLTYLNTQKLIPFVQTAKVSENEKNSSLEECVCLNINRLIELMGDDLTSNRLYYTPSFNDVKIIANQITRDSKLKALNFDRFVGRSKGSFSMNVNMQSYLENMIDPYFPDRDSKLTRIFSKLTELKEKAPLDKPELPLDKRLPKEEFAIYYLGNILYGNLSSYQQQCLKMDIKILLLRQLGFISGVFDPIITILFFASEFPSEFRKVMLENGLKLSSLKVNFMELPEIEAFRMKMRKKSDEGIKYIEAKQLNLSSVKPAEKEETKNVVYSNWNNLKKIFRLPLIHIKESFLQSESLDIFKGNSEFILFTKASKVNLIDSAKTLLNGLRTTYSEKVPKSYDQHELLDHKNIMQLRDAILLTIRESKDSISHIEEEMRKILDYPSSQGLTRLSPEEQQAVYQYRNRIIQGKIEAPSIQKHLIPSFLANQPKILKEVNPFLTDEQIKSLYDRMVIYMLQQSKVDQATEALALVKKAESKPDEADEVLHKAGVILSKERHYNPYEYPEMLIYEYATGHMLRNDPDQARLLKKIISILSSTDSNPSNSQELKRLFFEFQAGGGKTKVLSVILAAWAIKVGRVPFFYSLPSLLNISIDDIRIALQQVYQLGIFPLSIPLGKQLSSEEIVELDNLIRKGGVTVVTTPETWHSLHLQWQLQLSRKNYKDAKALASIFKFLKEKGVFIIDEQHRNGSSMSESNIAGGNPTVYPEYESDIVIKAYDVFYGWNDKPIKLSDGNYLHDHLGLSHNQQVSLSAKMRKEIFMVFAEYMMQFLQIPQDRHQEVFQYLVDEKSVSPTLYESLKLNPVDTDEIIPHDIDEHFWQKIDLVKGLITALLPHAFSQKDMIDYGPSPKFDDDVFDPYILGDPAGPKFQDPDVAVTLTVQGSRQHSLNENQMARYLTFKLKQLTQARIEGIAETADFIKKFNQLKPPQKYPLESIEKGHLTNPMIIAEYIKSLGRNRFVIAEFEKEFSVKKVKIYPYKFCSTSQEFSVGAKNVIHTSATLGTLEENPYVESSDLFITTKEFMSNVIQRAMLPHNQETHWIDDTTPSDFLENLHANNVDFTRVEGIINIGGRCKDASPKDWAEAVITFSQKHQLGYAGVIISKDERVGSSIEKRFYIVRPNELDVLIEGSDIKKALSKLNLSNARFFKVYSPELTTGTDLSLAPDAIMLFTIGENTSISAYVQAIMRMRGFLDNPIDPSKSQGLIWVGSPKIKQMLIELYGNASPAEALLHGVVCQVLMENDAIRMRSLQDIEMIVRGIVKDILEANPEKFDVHEGAFKLEMNNDPRSKYGVQVTEVETRAFLKSYAKRFAAKAAINLEDFPKAKRRIKAAIQQVGAKINMMESPVKASLGATLHQHKEVDEQQNQQVQQKQHKYHSGSSCLEKIEVNYANEELRIGSITALQPNPAYLANQVLGVDWLLPNLYFLPNFYGTTRDTVAGTTRDTVAGKNLKHSSFILAFQDKSTGKKDYRLISVNDAKLYSLQLQERDRKNEASQTAVIFTSNGIVHQTDRSAEGLSVSEIEKWQESDEFRLVLAQAGLIDGRCFEKTIQHKIVNKDKKKIEDLERIYNEHILAYKTSAQDNWERLKLHLNS